MSKSSTYQNVMCSSKSGAGKGIATYYGRKAGKGEKSNVMPVLMKYNKVSRKHEPFVMKSLSRNSKVK